MRQVKIGGAVIAITDDVKRVGSAIDDPDQPAVLTYVLLRRRFAVYLLLSQGESIPIPQAEILLPEEAYHWALSHNLLDNDETDFLTRLACRPAVAFELTSLELSDRFEVIDFRRQRIVGELNAANWPSLLSCLEIDLRRLQACLVRHRQLLAGQAGFENEICRLEDILQRVSLCLDLIMQYLVSEDAVSNSIVNIETAELPFKAFQSTEASKETRDRVLSLLDFDTSDLVQSAMRLVSLPVPASDKTANPQPAECPAKAPSAPDNAAERDLHADRNAEGAKTEPEGSPSIRGASGSAESSCSIQPKPTRHPQSAECAQNAQNQRESLAEQIAQAPAEAESEVLNLDCQADEPSQCTANFGHSTQVDAVESRNGQSDEGPAGDRHTKRREDPEAPQGQSASVPVTIGSAIEIPAQVRKALVRLIESGKLVESELVDLMRDYFQIKLTIEYLGELRTHVSRQNSDRSFPGGKKAEREQALWVSYELWQTELPGREVLEIVKRLFRDEFGEYTKSKPLKARLEGFVSGAGLDKLVQKAAGRPSKSRGNSKSREADGQESDSVK